MDRSDHPGSTGKSWEQRFSDSVEAKTKKKRTSGRSAPDSAFITEEDLGTIWDSDKELGYLFLGQTGLAGVNLQRILESSRKIISILITIVWKDWSDFDRIFWSHRDRDKKPDRTDKDMPFDEDDLRRIDFLGSYGMLFAQNQFKFIPMHFEEGGDYEIRSAMLFPFINEEYNTLGEGASGKVTKEVIARYHFKNSSGHNQVRV